MMGERKCLAVKYVRLYLRPVCEKRVSSWKVGDVKKRCGEKKVLLERGVWLSLQPARKKEESS